MELKCTCSAASPQLQLLQLSTPALSMCPLPGLTNKPYILPNTDQSPDKQQKSNNIGGISQQNLTGNATQGRNIYPM